MTDHLPGPTRIAMARDARAAEAIADDLYASGVSVDRVSTRTAPATTPGDVTRSAAADRRFAGKMGSAVGKGFAVAYLIGALVGLVGASIVFAPPWTSTQAAGIAAVVAFGVGWIAAGMGFLQAAIARAGEHGDGPAQQPLSGDADEHDRPEWGASDARPAADPDAPVELTIKVDDAQGAQVEAVLAEHRHHLVAAASPRTR